MKEIQICTCCGQKIVSYRHRLNKTLLNCLYKLSRKKIGSLKELGLTNNEFANFQKLKYFGLVDKIKSSYILTLKGKKFINGEETAPSYVITKNGYVEEYGPEILIYGVKEYSQLKEDWQNQATYK